jgi:hypothetical protein
MPESSETQDVRAASVVSTRGAELLKTRILEPIRKMTILTKSVGVLGVVAFTLLCYFAKKKVFKKRCGN